MTLKFIEQVSESDTIEEIWALLTKKMASYGFDRLLYVYTRFNIGSSLGDPKDSLVLTNHSEAYIDGFVKEGHYAYAPMLRWALENVGACSWGWMEEAGSDDMSPRERKVLEYNHAMGVIAGYSIAFKSDSTRNNGGIGMVARAGMSQADIDSVWEKHGREILMMNNVAHLKIISLPYASARQTLTPRQREVLEWVGEGKTVQDIATIMGLTSATVEKHLRLAREALDVQTSAQAVLKASFQNQIFVLEP